MSTKNENVFAVRFLEMGCSRPARSCAQRQRRRVSPALRGSAALAVSEEYEGASPVILHEGEGLRDVPHHKKQDGTALAHGSPRRGGWRRHSFGSVGRGFGGDSLSQGARRGESGQQVGHNGTWAHAAVVWREALEWVRSADLVGLLEDPVHEGIDYSFS
jgi:hypothetical protein